MKKLLEYLFPPKLPVFDIKEDIPEIEKYQYRITRRGVDLNPQAFYGVIAPPEIESDSKYFTVSGK